MFSGEVINKLKKGFYLYTQGNLHNKIRDKELKR